MPLKRNRKVALSREDKHAGRFVGFESIILEPDTVREVYIEGVNFALGLLKHVFTNGDGSRGVWYLVTSDTPLDAKTMIDIYHKRSRIEVEHKSLKQNASLERSPTRTEVTQTNHFFAALCGYIKLELWQRTTERFKVL